MVGRNGQKVWDRRVWPPCVTSCVHLVRRNSIECHQVMGGLVVNYVEFVRWRLDAIGAYTRGGCQAFGWNFDLRNLKCFGLVLYNQRTYEQVETTARFIAIKWSTDPSSQNSNDSCGLLHRRWRSVGGIFRPQQLDFRLWLNNQRCYGRTDVTGGFSAWNWFKSNPPRCSDCRLLMLYKVVKKLWAEICGLRLWRCCGGVAHLATTSRVTDKWMLQLDSACQKRPEITLERILIGVEECFTAERNGLGLSNSNCTWLLPSNSPILIDCYYSNDLTWMLDQHGLLYCSSNDGMVKV